MPDEAHEFALRLRTLMERRGYRQSDVAKGVGVSSLTMFRWYHGERMPTMPHARKLRRFLECSWEELLGL